jgi:hypothetical protein
MLNFDLVDNDAVFFKILHERLIGELNDIDRIVVVDKFKKYFFDSAWLLNEENNFNLIHNKFSRGKTIRQSKEQLIAMFRPSFTNYWATRLHSVDKEEEMTYDALTNVKNRNEHWWTFLLLLIFKVRFRMYIRDGDPIVHSYLSNGCENSKFKNLDNISMMLCNADFQRIGIIQYLGSFVVFSVDPSSTADNYQAYYYSKVHRIEYALIRYLQIFLFCAFKEAHDEQANAQVRQSNLRLYVQMKQFLYDKFLKYFSTTAI